VSRFPTATHAVQKTVARRVRHALPRLGLGLALLAIPGTVRAQALALAERGPRFLVGSVGERGGPIEIDASSSVVLRRVVSLRLAHATVGRLLEAISRQTGLRFFYSRDLVAPDRPVTLQADSITVASALVAILMDSGVDVMLSRSSRVALVKRPAPPPVDTGTVVGRVTDRRAGTGLVGATVWIDGTSRSATTDADGRYHLGGVAPGSYTVRARRIGYAYQRLDVMVVANQQTAADFALAISTTQLDSLVTTVTGERLRREVGHSVGRIEATQLVETAPVTSLTDLLTGRVGGVTVLSSGGTSGQGPRVRIRGLNSFSLPNEPLLYVDGVLVGGDAGVGSTFYWGFGRVSKLNDLNPEEIESIEIVKGPSAATLYGTQAANGVIRVTTKRGQAGAPLWRLWTEGGVLDDPATYPKLYFSQATGTDPNAECQLALQSLGACQVARLHTLDLLNADSTRPFTLGFRSQLGASIAGGTPLIRFFASAETELETGPIKLPDVEADFLRRERGTATLPGEQLRSNHFNKHSFRLNLAASPRHNIDASFSSGFVVNNIRFPQMANNAGGFIQNALAGSAKPAAYVARGGWGISRPADFVGTVTYRKTDHLINSGTINWRPVSWLGTRGTFGLDYLVFADDQNTLRGQGCRNCLREGFSTIDRDGFRTVDRTTNVIYTADVGATAQFGLTKRITSKTAAGVQYTHNNLNRVTASATQLPPGTLTLSAGTNKLLSEFTRDVITLGSYVEQQLGLDDRLFVTGALRIDENSSFGRNNRAAYYPKVSGSWVASDAGSGILSSLRFRAALGVSGITPAPQTARTLFSAVTATLPGGNVPGVTLGGLGDANLKPERSREIELGLDAGLFGGRLNAELTFYDRRATDALVARTLPYSLGGVRTRLENIGTLLNRGLEVSLSARVIERRALTWDVQLEASGNRNRLVSLGAGIPPGVGTGTRNQPGYPLFGLWERTVDSYSDANGDGIITPSEIAVSNDPVFLGSSLPTRSLTLNTSVSLFRSRLRVGAQLDYRGGHRTFDQNNLRPCQSGSCRELNDPSASLEDQANALAAVVLDVYGPYVENAEHIRFRELSLSYAASEGFAKLLRARSLNVTLSARNVALWTFGFKSWDPDNNMLAQDNTNLNFATQAQPVIGILRLTLTY